MLPLLPLIGIAASFVPEIVKVIAGDRAGQVAEAVGTAATTIFGTENPAQVNAQAKLDPEKAQAFKLELLRITAEQERAIREDETRRLLAELADTQGARQHTVDLVKEGSAIAWGPVMVSLMATGVFALFVWLLFTNTLPETMAARVDLLTGAAIVGYQTVLGYWLGSSAGSAAKNLWIKATGRAA